MSKLNYIVQPEGSEEMADVVDEFQEQTQVIYAKAGDVISKTWEVVNRSTKRWPDTIIVRNFNRINELSITLHEPVNIRLRPNESGKININLTVSKDALNNEEITGVFKLFDPVTRVVFGGHLIVLVHVRKIDK